MEPLPPSDGEPYMSTPSLPILQVVALALVQTRPDGQQRLFVARRGPERRHGGLWELPGGQVEPGESEAEALVREIREELSIEVELAERLGEATVSAGTFGVRMVVWVARSHHGTPTLIDHDQKAWLTAAELDAVSWAPADIPHLPALKRLLADP